MFIKGVKMKAKIKGLLGLKSLDSFFENKSYGYTKFYIGSYPIKAGLKPKEIDVESSNIHSVRYSSGAQELYIKFKRSGSTPTEYVYYDVPFIVYKKMLSAPSHGKFFHKEIKNRYEYEKIS